MKRLYKLVSTEKSPEGYRILLDGKPVKTAGKSFLSAPNEDTANTLVLEWAAQEAAIKPETMPLTQIIGTKIDYVSKHRVDITPRILKYLDTDLLCYRALGSPALVKKQQELWQPWLDWFADCHGVMLATTTDLTALKQPSKAHEALEREMQVMDDDRFTVLQVVTPLCGSVVLALAFVRGRASVQDVLNAAFLEEYFKESLFDAEKYGRDPIQEKQQNNTRRDLEACTLLLASLPE